MSMMDQPLAQHVRSREGVREYHVRVRNKVYLWGSAGIDVNVNFTPPLVLHISNDTFGELITIGTRKASHARETLGTLQAGEHFAIELRDISGVFAECDLESLVACAIERA